MGKTSFKVPGGFGYPVGNFLRQTAIVGESYRLIGFQIRGSSISDSIVQTNFEIGAKLLSLDVVLSEEQQSSDEVVKIDVPFTRELRVADLRNVLDVDRKDTLYNSMKINDVADEVIISATSDTPITLVLLFTKARGVRSVQENAQLIDRNGLLGNDTLPLSSHHSKVSKFSFKVEEGEEDLVEVEWNAVEGSTTDDMEVLRNAVDVAKGIFSEIF